MKRLVIGCIWLTIVAALFLAADQAMVRLPAVAGPGGELREGYLEWRQNLLQRAQAEASLPLAEPRYVYVDTEGGLHFADSLEEVPAPLRAEAQRLGN